LNIVDVIKFKYPHAMMFDFFVLEDNGVQTITEWYVKDLDGNDVPKPTQEDLLLWHEEMLANPKSPEPTTEERIAALEFTILQQLGL
jgi:hypothetical protein